MTRSPFTTSASAARVCGLKVVEREKAAGIGLARHPLDSVVVGRGPSPDDVAASRLAPVLGITGHVSGALPQIGVDGFDQPLLAGRFAEGRPGLAERVEHRLAGTIAVARDVVFVGHSRLLTLTVAELTTGSGFPVAWAGGYRKNVAATILARTMPPIRKSIARISPGFPLGGWWRRPIPDRPGRRPASTPGAGSSQGNPRG